MKRLIDIDRFLRTLNNAAHVSGLETMSKVAETMAFMIEAQWSLFPEEIREPEWISTKKTQPPKPNGAKYYSLDGEDIAADEYNVMIKGATEPTSLFWSGDVWFSPYGIDEGCTYNVTHWIPLPEPPKEGEQE